MTTRINPSNRFRWIFSAGVVMFLSANFVNAGNMLFNLLFSRWMGPALFSDLALLLTLKLSILGVLNAVQFLATEMVAKERPTRRPSIIQSYRFLSAYSSIILILCTPFLIGACYYFGWAEKLGISSELSLMVFFLGVPIYLPLALARGIAQGEIDLRRIVLSANAEMLVRLIGGAILWWAGFGITSVIFAFVLSLLTAWFFAKPTRPPRTVQPKPLRQSLPLLKALPWAAIQLTVVFALDGDVFVAKQIFDPESAGFIAAISLTQRIIFFASFSLAAILLPQVIAEIQLGNSGIRKATPILGLIALATIPILLILYFFPNEVVLILFGAEFSAISPYLYTAGLSATIVTINYFLVVFMMAHQAHRFAGLFLALSIAQIGYLYFSTHFSGADIGTFVEQKFMFQVISFALLSGLAALSAVKNSISKRTIE